MPLLADVLTLVERWYPAATAESWDAVGLVCGDPADEVGRVLLAVDPAPAVVQEAVQGGFDLLVTHHPMLLRGVSSVAATTPKGRAVTTLLRSGCALLTAHTNADQAEGGVSEAMAHALELTDQQPLQPVAAPARDKLTVMVPATHADRLRAGLAAAGAGTLGDYEAASFSAPGLGRFRPLPGATPSIGTVGESETVAEERVEVVLDRSRRGEAVRAVADCHPYEEPAYDVVELARTDAATGHGRVGTVAATTLRGFAADVAARLPATAHGVRVGGDPEREVRRVALCGGAGDFLLDAARRAEVDAYLTSDLRHHVAAEFLDQDGPALVDVAHWAAEWTWLPVLAGRLRAALRDTVEIRVSTLVTDPWTFRP